MPPLSAGSGGAEGRVPEGGQWPEPGCQRLLCCHLRVSMRAWRSVGGGWGEGGSSGCWALNVARPACSAARHGLAGAWRRAPSAQGSTCGPRDGGSRAHQGEEVEAAVRRIQSRTRCPSSASSGRRRCRPALCSPHCSDPVRGPGWGPGPSRPWKWRLPAPRTSKLAWARCRHL